MRPSTELGTLSLMILLRRTFRSRQLIERLASLWRRSSVSHQMLVSSGRTAALTCSGSSLPRAPRITSSCAATVPRLRCASPCAGHVLAWLADSALKPSRRNAGPRQFGNRSSRLGSRPQRRRSNTQGILVGLDPHQFDEGGLYTT